MKNKIRILLVGNDEADVLLIRQTLRQSDLDFSLHRVENETDFVTELRHQLSDIILSDHGFPSDDSFKALELARMHCPEVPFIFVTGAMEEDVAIASSNHGATDYVLKTRLPQLPAAIERARHEVEVRAARQQLEQDRNQLIKELKEALIQIKPMTGLLPVCALCQKALNHQDGSQLGEDYLQTYSDAALPHELCPECETNISPIMWNREQIYTESRTGV